MRSIVLATLVLLCACDDRGTDGDAACLYDGRSYAIGDVFPVGDGCNSCTCTASGPSCTTVACVDGGVDANPGACGAFGGCPEGPLCGALCCKSGERCVNGTCQCGTYPACGGGDSCEGVGPVGMDRCGTLCCGATSPCPQ